MNVNDKTRFADGPLAGKELRDIYRADRIEGDDWLGHYELVTVASASETDFGELRTRQEYRYRAPAAAEQ